MPIYDYHCKACDKTAEHLARYGDPTPKCASCGGPTLRALPRRTSFILKGGGWAADGYGAKRSK